VNKCGKGIWQQPNDIIFRNKKVDVFLDCTSLKLNHKNNSEN